MNEMKMFGIFPRPWVHYSSAPFHQLRDRSRNGRWMKTYDPRQWVVLAENGEVVMCGGTYSGDGDEENNLYDEHIPELVEIVNSYAGGQ